VLGRSESSNKQGDLRFLLDLHQNFDILDQISTIPLVFSGNTIKKHLHLLFVLVFACALGGVSLHILLFVEISAIALIIVSLPRLYWRNIALLK
jgi:ABC-type bacteriocin/lantibiotic exporter with double-glycine peptidase domain